MMKQIVVLILAALCMSGCMRYIISEPMPAIVPTEVSTAELPTPALAALQQREPNMTIVRVVAQMFKRNFTSYDVTISTPDGEKTYSLSPDGNYCEINQTPMDTQRIGAP
jgi:hypothetical protein